MNGFLEAFFWFSCGCFCTLGVLMLVGMYYTP